MRRRCYATTLLDYCIALLPHYSSTTRLHDCTTTTPGLHDSTTSRLRCSTTHLLHYSTTPRLRFSTTSARLADTGPLKSPKHVVRNYARRRALRTSGLGFGWDDAFPPPIFGTGLLQWTLMTSERVRPDRLDVGSRPSQDEIQSQGSAARETVSRPHAWVLSALVRAELRTH